MFFTEITYLFKNMFLKVLIFYRLFKAVKLNLRSYSILIIKVWFSPFGRGCQKRETLPVRKLLRSMSCIISLKSPPTTRIPVPCSLQKLRTFLKNMKSMKCDIVYFQETHFDQNIENEINFKTDSIFLTTKESLISHIYTLS
jgi:hypothetical protein